MELQIRFFLFFYVTHWVDRLRNAYVLTTEITAFFTFYRRVEITRFRAEKNFLEAGMHTSRLSTGAIKCIPAATVAIWWQAVGGGEDESCQWQPLKRTTHSPVTGETWWMIISRCDRCCDGGGALAILPILPPSPLSSSASLSVSWSML